MKNKYKAAIVGAGRMGAFFSKPGNYQGILTHAHAYRRDKRITLVAYVDTNKQRALRAAKVWGVNSYLNLEEMFVQEKPEIISICTSDETHGEVLEKCLRFKPKLVFCEKPFTTDIREAENLTKEYKKAGILLAVNYTRRWNQAIVKLRNKIQNNEYGKILNIVGYYNKGVLHVGSHLVDLVRFFFGEIIETIPLAARIDYKKNDPSLDFFLKLKNGIIAHFVSGDARQYKIFELDLIFEKGRLRLTKTSNLIEFSKIIDDPLVKGQRIMTPPKIIFL